MKEIVTPTSRTSIGQICFNIQCYNLWLYYKTCKLLTFFVLGCQASMTQNGCTSHPNTAMAVEFVVTIFMFHFQGSFYFVVKTMLEAATERKRQNAEKKCIEPRSDRKVERKPKEQKPLITSTITPNITPIFLFCCLLVPFGRN